MEPTEPTEEMSVEEEQEVAAFLGEDEDTEAESKVSADASPESNEESGEEASGESEKTPAAKPRRRRSRKKPAQAASSPLTGMAQAVEEAAEPTIPPSAPEPKTRRAKKEPVIEAPAATTFSANYIREDAVVADVSIHQSMDAMVKQWAAVREISTVVCSNLEKVAGTLQNLQTTYNNATSEFSRPDFSKSKTNNRLTVGASIVALILSVLSLTLSQSTRQSVMEQFAFRKSSSPSTSDSASASVADSSRTAVKDTNEIAWKKSEAAPRRRETPAGREARRDSRWSHDSKSLKK